MSSDKKITSVLAENRTFPPPAKFSETAHIRSREEYEKLYRYSIEQPTEFWREQALEHLTWYRPFTKVLSWEEPVARWFEDGKINAAFNCLDRHLESRGDKASIIWEGEPGDRQTITYRQLHAEVCKLANGLTSLGLVAGDVATIYMPMVPQAVIAMLACSRLGIAHNVIFAGFSADAIADRNNDCQAKIIITADGSWRRGELVRLKENVDKALLSSPSVKNVIVFQRTKHEIVMQSGRDIWWHDLTEKESPIHTAAAFSAEHPLFLLYTSGSTGKPKGILHTTAGFLLSTALSFKYVFDLKESDIYWCSADIGWVTGHSYVTYAPLVNGATVFMYEGALNQPDFARPWDMIERYKISILYTAPTAIRSFMKAGEHLPNSRDLSSLRLLGTVGEPINPEAWVWYHQTIGKSKCPIVDTWWQTETGSIMISPLPGAITTKPGTATLPFFGVDIDVVDKEGRPVPTNAGGYLVIKQPWPSMLRNIYGDLERFKTTYWQQVKGMYFTGDGARRDEDGYIWIMGRIDDVLNVSGHRLSTMEIESALVSHAAVAEAAVVGAPHEIKGESVFCFVTLKSGAEPSDSLVQELKAHVATHIGSIARPDEIRFNDTLPKTRSGKIMRRVLREIAAGRTPNQDLSTMEDQGSLDKLRTE